MKDPNSYYFDSTHNISYRKKRLSQQHFFSISIALLEFLLFFFFAFSLHQYMNFPLKAGALQGDRVKVDGSCPFCSGGQVWADNCQFCAAETDDYRLYCLSQAQSTLIQQSHLYLIYESLCLSFFPISLRSIPLPYMFLAFSYVPSSWSSPLLYSRRRLSLSTAKQSRNDEWEEQTVSSHKKWCMFDKGKQIGIFRLSQLSVDVRAAVFVALLK